MFFGHPSIDLVFKLASLPPVFLQALMDLVTEARIQTVAFKGEFAVWAEETWAETGCPKMTNEFKRQPLHSLLQDNKLQLEKGLLKKD